MLETEGGRHDRPGLGQKSFCESFIFSGFCLTKAIFTLSRLHLSLEMAVTYESCQPVVFTHVLSDKMFCELLLVSYSSSQQQLLILGWTSKP